MLNAFTAKAGCRMSETEEALDLAGSIYDAALDPSLWSGVIEKTCRFTNSVSGALASFDMGRRNLNAQYNWGYDPHYLKLLLDHYVHLNPMMAITERTNVGDVLSISQVMSLEELKETVFWREWAAPQGFIDGMQATIEKTPTAVAGVTMVRHESVGMVDEEALGRLRMLYPHYRRAVLIGKVIDLHKVEAATFADTIDGLVAGIFLVDADGRVIYANPSGEAMLETRDIFEPSRASFTARDGNADRALREALKSCESDERKIGSNGIGVPLSATSGAQYVAHVLPLTSGARRKAGLDYAAVAAIFVRKAALEPEAAFETMQQKFQLTPNEVRVLQALVEINGAAAIGAVLGMSESTVKTHLHHLFEKTGAERQADLVRLVAGFSSPLGR
jgi:DNA-binding CsgD family transcriptional regulator/PAS domain-containing protein